MECTIQKNTKGCTCTYPSCSRKGKCCECITYHRTSGELPACFFTAKEETTFDRSVEFFVRSRARQ